MRVGMNVLIVDSNCILINVINKTKVTSMLTLTSVTYFKKYGITYSAQRKKKENERDREEVILPFF